MLLSTYLNLRFVLLPSSVVHETVLTYGVLIFELVMDIHGAHQYNWNKKNTTDILNLIYLFEINENCHLPCVNKKTPLPLSPSYTTSKVCTLKLEIAQNLYSRWLKAIVVDPTIMANWSTTKPV